MNDEQYYTDKSENEVKKSVVEEELMPVKSKSRLFSVIALVFSIVSLLLFSSYLGMIIAAVGIGFALVSRVKLGYFDRSSVGALIVGVFGAALSFIYMIFNLLLK